MVPSREQVHEGNPQTGSSILFGLSKGVGINRGPLAPIAGVNGVVQLCERSGVLQDLRVEVPDRLYDLGARPGIGLCHEHVKGL